jgi:murein DD-endopeptidase MepM/ murein hydrolase activator NlpD
MGIFKCNIGFIWSLVFAVLIAVIPRYWELKIESIRPLPSPSPAIPKTEVVENTIRRNTTLVATLVDHNIPTTIANDVAGLIKPVFDVRRIRFGNPFRLEKEIDGSLKAFEYKIDDESVLLVSKEADSYAAKVQKLDLNSREATIAAEIQSSLWEALDSQPKGEYLVQELADIFQWAVDFSTEIQPGDAVRLIVDEQLHDGQFVKYGKIHAAELVNNGRTYRAYRFKDAYYDDNGIALKRAMLASPLKFTPRISSGFSRRRMHPILGRARAHLATDYAAPTGSPVVAVAKGTVTFAGWNAGYGNLVQIRHANGLTSGYAHLSAIASGVRAGRVIEQGDSVGRVGQTGLATGPHLHFMMTKSGVAINPVPTLKKGEAAPPIQGGLKTEFLTQISPIQLKLGVQLAAKQPNPPGNIVGLASER